jgi:NAD(P)-dependent dehydrogenase (short-subunit alcohol dehydrogenase family)
MKALEGKVAVITGGSSGIGLSTAKLFLERGAKVAITGRTQQTLDQATNQLGPSVLAVRSDVSKLAELDVLFTTVTKKFGRIDVLFANAGIAKFAPVGDVTEALFNELFDVNVKGVFFAMQKAVPHLNNNASVILNASVANRAGLPSSSIYAATKAAVRSFARTFAAELADRGIRVNVISPGPIATPLYDKLGLSKEQLDEFATSIVSQVPLKRMGQPDEVAQAALFLAADAASYINGVELNVDGGFGQV